MKYAHVAIAFALTSTAVAGVYAETRHAPVVIDLLKPDTRTVGDVLVPDKPVHAIVDAYLDPLDDPQLMYPKIEGPGVSAEGDLYPGHAPVPVDLLKLDTRTVGDVLVPPTYIQAYLDPLDDPQLMYQGTDKPGWSRMVVGAVKLPACDVCDPETPTAYAPLQDPNATPADYPIGPSGQPELQMTADYTKDWIYAGHGTIEGAEVVNPPKATVTIEDITITEAPTLIARNR